MKRLRDMTPVEACQFSAFSARIAEVAGRMENAVVDKKVGLTNMDAALLVLNTCVYIRVHDMSIRNAKTAFEVDKDAFVKEAAETGMIFFDNCLEVAKQSEASSPEERKEFEERQGDVERLLKDPTFAIALKVAFENVLSDETIAKFDELKAAFKKNG